MRRLRPAEYRNSIFEIDLDKLRRMGKRAILLDMDNTLVRYDDCVPSPALLDWLAAARARGMQLCIVSNNGGSRVRDFAARLGLPCVCRAIKPRVKGFAEAMQLLGVQPKETVVVGDQLFTDVLGGNRAGAYTILVVPIGRSEFFGTRLVRIIERRVLSYLRRQSVRAEK